MLKSHDLALIGISGPNRLFISIYMTRSESREDDRTKSNVVI